jgi:hypothetical protein
MQGSLKIEAVGCPKMSIHTHILEHPTAEHRVLHVISRFLYYLSLPRLFIIFSFIVCHIYIKLSQYLKRLRTTNESVSVPFQIVQQLLLHWFSNIPLNWYVCMSNPSCRQNPLILRFKLHFFSTKPSVKNCYTNLMLNLQPSVC